MNILDNTGIIFKNNDRKNERHPEYRGTIKVDGKELNIALWVKRAKTEKQQTFFSCSISEKVNKKKDPTQAQENDLPLEETEDPINYTTGAPPF